MRRYLGFGLLVACACALPAQGQEGDSSSPPASASKEEVVELTGDIITLRSGKVISSVQILYETPREYMLLVVEGVDPLAIPRRQVRSVVKDDIEPMSKRYQARVEKEDAVSIFGQPIPPELVQALQAPLTGSVKTFKDMDFMLVLKELAGVVRVPLEFDPSVEKLPRAKRLWTVKVEPGTDFLTLRTLLLKDFPTLSFKPVDQKILVTTKAAGKAPAAQNPGGVR